MLKESRGAAAAARWKHAAEVKRLVRLNRTLPVEIAHGNAEVSGLPAAERGFATGTAEGGLALVMLARAALPSESVALGAGLSAGQSLESYYQQWQKLMI